MPTSLAATVVILGIGAVSRIPAENIAASANFYTDAALFKLLVFGANALVIGQLVGKIKLVTQGLITFADENELIGEGGKKWRVV